MKGLDTLIKEFCDFVKSRLRVNPSSLRRPLTLRSIMAATKNVGNIKITLLKIKEC